MTGGRTREPVLTRVNAIRPRRRDTAGHCCFLIVSFLHADSFAKSAAVLVSGATLGQLGGSLLNELHSGYPFERKRDHASQYKHVRIVAYTVL